MNLFTMNLFTAKKPFSTPTALVLFSTPTALVLTIIASLALFSVPGCGGGNPPQECNEWHCERTGMVLKIKNKHAHFTQEGNVVAIRPLKETLRDKVWEAKGMDTFVISKVGDAELYVGTENSDDKVAGIYIPLTEKNEYLLPIDLDGRNHIDISVEVVPGEKPKVTVEDRLVSFRGKSRK